MEREEGASRFALCGILRAATGRSYLTDVDKSTHQVLVTERTDGLLRLFSCGIFHDPSPLNLATWTLHLENVM